MLTLTGQGDITASPDLNAFVLSHGRFPWLSDEIPPWRYRGWLLHQVQIADSHPRSSRRWDHYMRTLEAGKLLDEPIPRIQFAECPDAGGRKMIEKSVATIEQRDSAWSAFQRFAEWLAWGLAVSNEMPLLEEATHEALYRIFNLEPLLVRPHDYLGRSSRNAAGGAGTRMRSSRLRTRSQSS